MVGLNLKQWIMVPIMLLMFSCSKESINESLVSEPLPPNDQAQGEQAIPYYVVDRRYQPLHGDLGSYSSSYTQRTLKGDANYKSDFRVFVPPGTHLISLKIYAVNNAYDLYAVSRFKKPPQDYGGPPAYEEGGYTLRDLADDNQFSRNKDGLIRIIESQNMEPVVTQESGWLYVRVLGGSEVKIVKYRIDYRDEMFKKWYSAIDWQGDVERQ